MSCPCQTGPTCWLQWVGPIWTSSPRALVAGHHMQHTPQISHLERMQHPAHALHLWCLYFKILHIYSINKLILFILSCYRCYCCFSPQMSEKLYSISNTFIKCIAVFQSHLNWVYYISLTNMCRANLLEGFQGPCKGWGIRRNKTSIFS